jgi:hypothetical protein
MWLPVDGSDAPKIPSGKDKRLKCCVLKDNLVRQVSSD